MTGNKIILEDLEIIANALIDWQKFNGKTVLVSGANGFLPAYMVESLLFLLDKKIITGLKILALVRNLTKAKARFKYYLNRKELLFINQDVCNFFEIPDKIDFIIHAASQASPKYFGTDPVGILKANTVGTINLLNIARINNVDSFLFFSTSEVYGLMSEDKIPTRENEYGYLDPTNVRSCYAESKRMGETICVSYLHQYGIPVKIIRPFHTYGPGMALDDGRVHADFISDIVNNRDINMKSDGSAIRSFCYLSDATRGFFKVFLDGGAGEAYNIGNKNNEISIINLANLLVNMFPEKKLRVIKQKAPEGYLQSKIIQNSPDITKANAIGWFPEISLEDGFFRTIKSYINE
jgi:nucleoside-diphosphate-sugar epimerase